MRIRAMKRYLMPILIILMLSSALLSGCVQEEIIPPQPDARLIEFQQMKLTQLEQANRELADHRAEINETESKLERLNNLMEAAYERISEEVGHPVGPGSIIGVHRFTAEELGAPLAINGLTIKLSQLYKQEQLLLATKQYLEQDNEEIKQYTHLGEYHEFKLSQLEDLNVQLIELRIDIDQKTLLGGELTSAQQEYSRLLVQRHLLQQDIEQLEQLLEKGLKGA